MNGLPKPDGLSAYVDGLFAQDRSSAERQWEDTPEGRALADAERRELQRIPKPIDPRNPDV